MKDECLKKIYKMIKRGKKKEERRRKRGERDRVNGRERRKITKKKRDVWIKRWKSKGAASRVFAGQGKKKKKYQVEDGTEEQIPYHCV